MGPSGSKRASSPQTGGKREAVRVRLLGGFRVSVGSRTIPRDAWRSTKAAALVKMLALAPGHRVHRERVMNLLWPDSGKKAASNNLRQVVYGARKVLDPASNSSGRYLNLKDEHIVLCPEGRLWVDVDAFDDAAATARRSRNPATYRAAIGLYADELLPEDRYEEWAEGKRNELRQLYLALLIELAGLYEGRGEHALAVEALRRAVTEEPTLEEAHASLMRLHALSGRPERALAQYERLRSTLSEELGTGPSLASRRLRDEIAALRLPTAPPADPTRGEPSDAARHNLPAARTSFVGREREMVEVKRTLAMTRLLTLTGAGGTGKTRLAIEVARDLVGSYPDGVWLVELASLSEPGLVVQEAANAMGVQERPGEPLTNTLADALADKGVLLVLDNCEHLVEEAARLADALLASCPHLKVLATSREPLGVSGEVNWAAPPLSVPDATKGELTADTLVRYEAVRLFVDRARLRLLDFKVTQENAGAVARVCRKLEGIPLAIELATARMGSLAVEQVAQRLETSLDVLKGTSRTTAPRQQTLRATLDWSHDLLSDDERAFFGRLSVFAGGWTLGAAEAVCLGDGIEEDDVLDLLGGLVDKSLVVARAASSGALRYRMLEPVRQYAREKLMDSGDGEQVRSEHAAFLAKLAEEAESGLLGINQGIWLNRVQAEHDNIRAALSWALEDEDTALGLRIAGALMEYWRALGHNDEGRGWLEALLAKGGEVPARTQAKALEAVGWLAQDQGDLERADTFAEAGLELCAKAELGDDVAARFLRVLEMGAWLRGDYTRMKDLAKRSLALFREVGDKRGMARSLTSLASVASAQGDGEYALELSAESMTLAREVGATDLISHMLVNSGYEFFLQGDYERATSLNEEAAALARGQGDKDTLHYALDNLGWAALMREDYQQAEASFRENLVLCQELSDKLIASESLEGLACLVGVRGEAGRVARLFGAADTLREAVGFHQSPAERALREPYLVVARVRLAQGAWEAAFAEGRAMTFEEATEFALSEEEPAPPASPVPRVPPTEESVSGLTRREREIAALASRGLTNRQIATELSISERTAGNHVAKILKKLGLRSRAQIASWVSET